MEKIKKLLFIVALLLASSSIFASTIIHIENCDETQTIISLEKNCISDCNSSLRDFSMPVSVVPEQRISTINTVSINSNVEKEVEYIENSKFGVKECVSNCNSSSRDFSMPVSVEPRTLINKITQFITDCFK